MNNRANIILLLLFQIILFLLFAIFVQYAPNNTLSTYPMFQDIHVMIFIGFGFLMTFLKRYGYSSVGFNFLLGALIIQWAIVCQGFYHLNDNYRIEVGINSLYAADIAAAAVLISMGAVLGRTSYMQLVIMGIIEIAVFSANSYIGLSVFKVSDAGASIFVHVFGAYFGLAVSYVLGRKEDKSYENKLEGSTYNSDLFAMIGTIFLWLYWPSFNAIELKGDDQQRAVINTYLSLAACCVTTFAISLMLTEEHKFDMVHIQNSTLAGGVAVGAAANLMLEPCGAIIVGMTAAVLSVFGYARLTPWLSTHFGIKDTCGVHNLHGMPGVLAGLVGALMAGIATEKMYHKSLYEIYPARASPSMTASAEYNFLQAGDGRSAGDQAGYQILALSVTLVLAIITGLITGLVLSFNKLKVVSSENYYDDVVSWTLPEVYHNNNKNSGNDYDNPSFEMEISKAPNSEV